MEMKTILVVLVLNILLPTLDTVTDFNLVYKLYRGAEAEYYRGRWETHPVMATAMLLPFLLNYVVCLITFFRRETNRRFTFIFPLLNIYPQFGENHHIKRNQRNYYLQYFRGRQDNLPLVDWSSRGEEEEERVWPRNRTSRDIPGVSALCLLHYSYHGYSISWWVMNIITSYQLDIICYRSS